MYAWCLDFHSSDFYCNSYDIIVFFSIYHCDYDILVFDYYNYLQDGISNYQLLASIYFRNGLGLNLNYSGCVVVHVATYVAPKGAVALKSYV